MHQFGTDTISGKINYIGHWGTAGANSGLTAMRVLPDYLEPWPITVVSQEAQWWTPTIVFPTPMNRSPLNQDKNIKLVQSEHVWETYPLYGNPTCHLTFTF